jgi:hypothetical protein
MSGLRAEVDPAIESENSGMGGSSPTHMMGLKRTSVWPGLFWEGSTS